MEYIEDNIDYIDLGLRVRRKREELGLSQEKLAAAADISQVTLIRLERAQTKAELATLVRVTNALHSSLDELLCASLNCSTAFYQQEYGELVKNCSAKELRLVNDVVASLLKTFRHHCAQSNR